MNKVDSTKEIAEALMIVEALELYIKSIKETPFKDKELFNYTLKFVNSIKIKYYKIALTKMYYNRNTN